MDDGLMTASIHVGDETYHIEVSILNKRKEDTSNQETQIPLVTENTCFQLLLLSPVHVCTSFAAVMAAFGPSWQRINDRIPCIGHSVQLAPAASSENAEQIAHLRLHKGRPWLGWRFCRRCRRGKERPIQDKEGCWSRWIHHIENALSSLACGGLQVLYRNGSKEHQNNH